MTTSSVNYVAAATTVTGNQVTITGNTITAPHTAGNTSGQPISAVKFAMRVVGDIHGLLRFPFADPESFDGILLPADLRTAQIKLTQGGAGAALALIAEEVYPY